MDAIANAANRPGLGSAVGKRATRTTAASAIVAATKTRAERGRLLKRAAEEGPAVTTHILMCAEIPRNLSPGPVFGAGCPVVLVVEASHADESIADDRLADGAD